MLAYGFHAAECKTGQCLVLPAGASYPLGRSPAKAAGAAAATAVEAAAPALAPPEPQAPPAAAAPLRTTAAAECARTARLEREVEELRAQILMRERREAESAAAVHAKDVVRLQSEVRQRAGAGAGVGR